jgi:S-adenosylmethionine hydrolase
MKVNICTTIALFICFLVGSATFGQNNIIVFQSDFGLKDGAVSEMKGIAMSVSPDLKLFDLTHEIPAYNIWEAAVRLQQTVPYWPAGTVFVSVVDPGVGTDRKRVIVKTKTGQLIVTPDNGTLTLIAESPGIEEIREIDKTRNRRSNSQSSYTFEGRDVFAYAAAKLASGIISFKQVGPAFTGELVLLQYNKAVCDGKMIKGTIMVMDEQYGNVWTNIDEDILGKLSPKIGDILQVTLSHLDKIIYTGKIPYCKTFGDVLPGKPLAYINSLMQLSFALNQANFAETYQIRSGNEWTASITLK